MMVRPWRLGDTGKIVLQEAQRYVADIGNIETDLTPLSNIGLAWTAEHDGEIIACGGLMPQWEHRAIAWMIIGENAGPHFVALHRHVYRGLVKAPYRRIEAHVDVGFAAGVKWMKMLGFELEAYKRAYRPDGADMLQFVRIRI